VLHLRRRNPLLLERSTDLAAEQTGKPIRTGVVYRTTKLCAARGFFKIKGFIDRLNDDVTGLKNFSQIVITAGASGYYSLDFMFVCIGTQPVLEQLQTPMQSQLFQQLTTTVSPDGPALNALLQAAENLSCQAGGIGHQGAARKKAGTGVGP
jgi:hypothetical protein